ncbi:MAG TPA: pyridoxamine 5'-phosphate oxidase family protein [Candidatus Saccharimonadales bacterium]|nr:pyridoxamine 5'-phosphate oxidase family protein [Candidatus Saccharimonadales bacterium]
MSVDVQKAIRDYLPNVIHLSLATSKDGQPWVCELHYAFDDDLNLYFRSLSSRRHSQEIALNPKVAGNIVRQHQPGEYPLGVYFEGVAEQLHDVDVEHPAYRALHKRFNVGQKVLDEAAREGGHQFYKISVTTWYVFGKLAGEEGKKYELAWDGSKRK